MSRFVTEHCVAVRALPVPPVTTAAVLELARALGPYLAVQPAEVTATLVRCGIDPHRQPIAR